MHSVALQLKAFSLPQHNPWRSPGSAPVMDACGLAGGSYSRQNGTEAGHYTPTAYAEHGDVGTEVLGPLPGYKPPTYKIGGTAEVVWSIQNNHGKLARLTGDTCCLAESRVFPPLPGGGYQYRIAPLPDNFTDLKESDFIPLDFVEEEQSIVFMNGTTLKLSATQRTCCCLAALCALRSACRCCACASSSLSASR